MQTLTATHWVCSLVTVTHTHVPKEDIVKPIYNSADLRLAFHISGSHQFSSSAKRFFNARVHNTMYAGRAYVESQTWDGVRFYVLYLVTQDEHGRLKAQRISLTHSYSTVHTRARRLSRLIRGNGVSDDPGQAELDRITDAIE